MTLSRFPYNPFLSFYAESCSSWLEGPARHGGDAADDEYILPMQVKTKFHYFFITELVVEFVYFSDWLTYVLFDIFIPFMYIFLV